MSVKVIGRMPEDGETLPFVGHAHVATRLRACEYRETCHGGCAGRRKLQGALDELDIYCPIIRGERPRLDIKLAATRDLPKIGSACTTVVIAR